MTTKIVSPILAVAISGCASTTAYYPPMTTYDDKGRTRTLASKAFQTYGDSLGGTAISVTSNGVKYAAAGGNMNSPTTGIIAGEIGRTTRFGFSALAWYGILKAAFGLGQGISNNVANTSTTNAATAAKTAGATKAAPLPTVGSTIPAQTTATVAAPAVQAGSTIPAEIPAVVTPVIPVP